MAKEQDSHFPPEQLNPENFWLTVKQRVKDKLPPLQERETNRVLNEIIAQCTSFLPLTVVHRERMENYPTCAFYIGNLHGQEIYWQEPPSKLYYEYADANRLVAASEVRPGEANLVKEISLLSEEKCNSLLRLLKERVSQEKQNEVIVPPGYTLIRYQSEWGESRSKETKTMALKTDSEEEILTELRRTILRSRNEFFWGMEIYQSTIGDWRKVISYEEVEGERKPLPPHRPISRNNLLGGVKQITFGLE